MVGVHRVSYEVAFGPIPEGMCVCHRCDVPSCVNPEHLFLGTVQDNSDDMVAKGRSASGDRNPARLMPERMSRGTHRYNAKLTEVAVKAIPGMRASGMTVQAIADAFGCSRVTVSAVIHGRTWKHAYRASE